MKKTAIILMCVMLGGVLSGCSGNTVPLSVGDFLCHSFIEVEYKNFYRNGNLRYCSNN